MWVDIANLVGPQGNPGKDGDKGDPGPVNIGLDPNSPIGWDQTGGFTFNFVDGSEQTVNLPIASAQSAGLLGGGGAMPTTGDRDITSLIVGTVIGGALSLSRVGPFVTLNVAELQTAESGSRRICDLPAGFRPGVKMNDEWTNRGSERGYLDIYASGAVWGGSNTAQAKYSRVLTFPTRDSWPTSLPGTAI